MHQAISREPWLRFSQTGLFLLQNHWMNPIKPWNLEIFLNPRVRNPETTFRPLGLNLTCFLHLISVRMKGSDSVFFCLSSSNSLQFFLCNKKVYFRVPFYAIHICNFVACCLRFSKFSRSSYLSFFFKSSENY